MGIQTVETRDTRWLILATVMVGTFLGRLDQSIVNLALPKIINDFSISVSAAGWIATAYILANAVFVPIWGKLGDTVGRKRVYILGFAIFILGSALAGLAWNLSSMIVFRVLQAIASSADYPTAMAILAVTFTDPKERGQALGIWSAMFAAGGILGPLIGGPLIDLFGWRSVFLVNIPIGIIGLAMAVSFVPESTSNQKIKHFDWWGATALGIALSSLVLVLDKGIEWGWLSAYSGICYALILAFGAFFLHIEQQHPEPMIDLRFFGNSVFVESLANNFIVFAALMGSVFLIPIFAQTFLGYDATQTGYLFLPMAFAMMFAAPLGGSLAGKMPAGRVVAISTAGAAFGLYLFSIFIDVRSSATDIIIPLFVMAFGLGIGMAQRTNAIAAAVPERDIGTASAILALARNVAGAFGIALFGTVLNESIKQNILSIASKSTLTVHTPETIRAFTSLIELKAQVAAYHTIFILGAWVMLAGAAVALFVKVPEKKVSQQIVIE